MGLFGGCKHDWIVVAKTFMEPNPKGEDDWIDTEYAERCRAGVTTVLMVCGDCGAKSVTEMLGKEIA
jgi:hypothetical protein